MASHIHGPFTSVYASTDDLPAKAGQEAEVDGKRYRFVQFKDAVTYAAGQSLTLADVNWTSVTNDRAGGSSIGAIFGGVCLAVPAQNGYGWVLIYGPYATLLTSGADDIVVGECLICHATTDGTCDGVAANARTTAAIGVATTADVDGADTVAAFVGYCV